MMMWEVTWRCESTVPTQVSSLSLLNDLLSPCVILVKAGLLFHCWQRRQPAEPESLSSLSLMFYMWTIRKCFIVEMINFTPSQQLTRITKKSAAHNKLWLSCEKKAVFCYTEGVTWSNSRPKGFLSFAPDLLLHIFWLELCNELHMWCFSLTFLEVSVKLSWNTLTTFLMQK